jgi:DNA-binding NtrC family response regulator
MKPTLLCVDDDLIMLKTYERAFKNAFRVIVAHDQEQATILAESADVILSDWNLAVGTSREFLLHFPHKPTVVISGHPTDVELEHAWLILPKPTDMADIQRALLEALGGRDVAVAGG